MISFSVVSTGLVTCLVTVKYYSTQMVKVKRFWLFYSVFGSFIYNSWSITVSLKLAFMTAFAACGSLCATNSTSLKIAPILRRH